MEAHPKYQKFHLSYADLPGFSVFFLAFSISLKFLNRHLKQNCLVARPTTLLTPCPPASTPTYLPASCCSLLLPICIPASCYSQPACLLQPTCLSLPACLMTTTAYLPSSLSFSYDCCCSSVGLLAAACLHATVSATSCLHACTSLSTCRRMTWLLPLYCL